MGAPNAMTTRNQYRYPFYATLLGAAVIAPLIVSGAKADPPKIAPAYQGKLVIEAAGDLGGGVQPTQMVWGPEGRLYAMTNSGGVYSFRYNAATGALTDKKTAGNGYAGIGIAFHKSAKGVVGLYLTVYDAGNTGSIVKLTDDNGNGVYGETNETNVKIVTGIPTGDHAVDQLLVQGDTLYVGIGPRTINGRKGDFTSGSLDDFGGKGFWSGGNGQTFGDSPLGGTICYIEDLNSVADTTNAANPYGATNPVHNQNFYQQNALPYTIEQTVNPQTLKGKLRVHSAGTRNPFGMAFDKNGELYFTVNFNRVKTAGDGSAPFGYLRDSFGTQFNADVYDQVFHASKGADYGYSAQNWRNRADAPILNPTDANYHRVLSLTYDQLFNKGPYTLHDPANPDGMGPSASADGCAFFYASNLPKELLGNLFIARYTNYIETSDRSQSLVYQDVVAVDTATGTVRRVAQEFVNPLCVLADNYQRLLIGDFSTGKIWAIRPMISRLSVGATLTRPAAIQATAKFINSGDRTLSNVTITGVKLNGKATTTALPFSVGSLTVGASQTRTLVFPASAATPGQASILSISGTYQGGNFNISQRMTAP